MATLGMMFNIGNTPKNITKVCVLPKMCANIICVKEDELMNNTVAHSSKSSCLKETVKEEKVDTNGIT